MCIVTENKEHLVELEYRLDILWATKEARVEIYWGNLSYRKIYATTYNIYI